MIAALPSPSINASEGTEMLPETLKDKQKILKSAATVQEQAYFF